MLKEQLINNLSLILITDRNHCKQPLIDTIRSALKGGVKTVQLREKGLATHELYSLACELRKITSDFKANFIVNDRVDIALAVEADGVHLGWQSLPSGIVRKLLGFEKLIGVSTHNRQEALQAQDNGADYITFGPIFDNFLINLAVCLAASKFIFLLSQIVAVQNPSEEFLIMS